MGRRVPMLTVVEGGGESTPDRPSLTVVDGRRRGRRWPHPAGAALEPGDGPEAV